MALPVVKFQLTQRTRGGAVTPGRYVQVFNADGTTPATLYSDAVRTSTVSAIRALDANGQPNAWMEIGDYWTQQCESDGTPLVVDGGPAPLVPHYAVSGAEQAAESVEIEGLYENVKAHGAVGGLFGTVDDTAAFAAAISVVAAELGTVFTPAGVYKLTDTLTIPNYVEMLGAGLSNTTLRFDTLDPDAFGVEITETNTTGHDAREIRSVCHLHLQGSSILEADGQRGMRWLSGILAERVWINGFWVGLYAWGDHQKLSDAFITGNRVGIYFPAGTPTQGNNKIIDSVITGNELASIDIEEGANCQPQLDGAHLGFSPYGIHAQAGSSTALQAAELDQVNFEDCGDAAIETNGRGIIACDLRSPRFLMNDDFALGTPHAVISCGVLRDTNISGPTFNLATGSVMPDTAFIKATEVSGCNFTDFEGILGAVVGANWPLVDCPGDVYNNMIEGGSSKVKLYRAFVDVTQGDFLTFHDLSGNTIRVEKSGVIPMGVALHSAAAGKIVAVLVKGRADIAKVTGALGAGSQVRPSATAGKVEDAVTGTNNYLPTVGLVLSGASSGATTVRCEIDVPQWFEFRTPSAGEKAALAGSDGTPGSGNKYLTQTGLGVSVQAYDAELAALAGLASAADKFPYFTGAGTAALATVSTYMRTLLDDPDAATAAATLAVVANAIIDAKGDLIVGTANDTPARKAVGSNGTYLRAESANSDGLAWTAPFVVDTHANRLAAAHVAGRLWKESDTNLIYLDDGTNWIIWKGDGAVRKTAIETVNNSAALQNDDHLFFPIEANEVWFVEALLQIQGASTTADFLFGFTGPPGASASWAPYARPGDGVTGASWLGAPLATSPIGTRSLAQTTAIGGSATTSWVILGGTFTAVGTAGTIRFQWAQNTATAENNSVLADSFLRLRRLA